MPNRRKFNWLIFSAIAFAFVFPEFAAAPAYAESSQTLFQRLFKPSNKETRVKPRITRKKNIVRRKKRKSRNNNRAAAASPVPAKTEKLENARVVLVVGDFLAGGLAEGLEIAFADSPGVRIVEKSNGSSGVVRDDYYNWQVALPQLLVEHEPSALVIMIGANDRQDFRTTKPPLARRSDQWRKEYENRVATIAKLVTDKNIPLVWVGMPSFRSPRMSSDMVAFNDIYRRVSTEANGAFVDIWNGFVNEAGAFVTSGPDINGQPARLRAGDGINVSRAGRRKIAFYTEKPLRKILGNAAAPDVGELGPENLPTLTLEPANVPNIDRTIPIAFDDPELDGGTELLGANVEADLKRNETPTGKLTVDGLAGTPKPGRADDFKWKPALPDTAEGGSTRP